MSRENGIEDETCEYCNWWVWYTGVYHGSCHRRSPIAISDKIHHATPTEIRNPYPDEIEAGWPHVLKGNSCGDFEKKAGEQ